jgi:uncharacterized protein YidB (DUF937 family)
VASRSGSSDHERHHHGSGTRGLFDNLKAEAAGVLGHLSGEHPQLAQEVTALLQNHPGGLAGLVQQFKSAGLGQLVSSWVGTGANLPATARQIEQGLGADRIKQLAARVGLDPTVVSQKLSTVLPALIDHLTPNGQLPAQAPPAR